MARNNNSNKKQISNTKERKGDKGRTSNQGQKAAQVEVLIQTIVGNEKEYDAIDV